MCPHRECVSTLIQTVLVTDLWPTITTATWQHQLLLQILYMTMPHLYTLYVCMYVSFKLLSHLSVYMHLLASVDIDDCHCSGWLCFHRHLYWKQSFSLCLCSLWIMRRNHHTRSRSRSRTPRNIFASCPQAQKTWLRFGWPWMMWMSRLCLKKPATCMRWKKMLRWEQWWAQSAPWTPTELAALSSKAKCLFLLQPHQLKKGNYIMAVLNFRL